jgi:hypothetical protein
MNFEALHDSRFVKYLSTAHLIHFVLFGVVPTALGIISGLNIPDQPLEIKVLCGFAVALLVYLAILFVLMRWEKYQEKQEESLPILYTRNITTKQARSLFDVALRKFLFLAHFAEAVANKHAVLLHLRRDRASIFRARCTENTHGLNVHLAIGSSNAVGKNPAIG